MEKVFKTREEEPWKVERAEPAQTRGKTREREDGTEVKNLPISSTDIYRFY